MSDALVGEEALPPRTRSVTLAIRGVLRDPEMQSHDGVHDFSGEQEETFPTAPTRLGRSISGGSERSGRRDRQSASPPERHKGRKQHISAK